MEQIKIQYLGEKFNRLQSLDPDAFLTNMRKEAFETFNATDAGKEMSAQVSPLLANPPVVAEFDRLIQP